VSTATAGYGRFYIICPDKTKLDFAIRTPELILGPHAGAGLQLTELDSSARFEWRAGNPVIIDTSGGHGLTVNQSQVGEHALRQGDVIRLGDYFMVYHLPQANNGAGTSLDWSSPKATMAEPASALLTSAVMTAPNLLPDVISGRLEQQHLSGADIRIGRDPSNTIVLDHLQVSRFHAEITLLGESYVIRDLGSTNGTWVNGERIEGDVTLNRGDHIKISDFNFFFDGHQIEHFSEAGNARIDAVELRRELKHDEIILHDVSFSIYPREFVAIVGGSGTGKSTLVNALSGFYPADKGIVLLNGVDYYHHMSQFRSTLGYVPQDDIIHSELTVGRALYYAALLRMPEDVTESEITRRIDEVLHELQLTERRDVPVSRLSGGQRKRVSIGVELLTRPRLFYLDEPTSGLDPGMEAEMMRIFRALADRGHTVIVITHATRNIMKCDKVVFLARGGHLAFYGTPREALEYFGTDDFADIYLEVEHEKTPEVWAEKFRASRYYKVHVADRLSGVNDVTNKLRNLDTDATPLAEREARSRFRASFRQWFILTRRYVEILMRDRTTAALLLLQAPILAGFLWVYCTPGVFAHFDMDSFLNSESAPDKMAMQGKVILFLLVLFSMMCGTINSVREIVRESAVYRRERTVNLRIFPYVMSKMAVLCCVSVFQVAVFVSVVFTAVRPPPDVDNFLALAFLALLAVHVASTALGLAISAAFRSQNTSIYMIPIVLLCQIILSGALLPLQGLKALSSCTLMKWGFDMLGSLTRLWRVLPSSIDFAGQVPTVVRPLVDMGAAYRESFDVSYWYNFSVLLGFTALFLLLTCLLMRAKDRARA
jgi:ABC-type multidrug transport system ATPase subunit/pSer/pThr/pTyr-binding forkhead associated (FHA) protein